MRQAGGRESERLRVVVAGLMGALPVAGLTAHYLQYVLGLRQLGHEVLYLEDTEWYYDPWTKVYCDAWNGQRAPAAARPPNRLRRILAPYGLDDCWTWTDIGGARRGLDGRRLDDFLRTADLFVHVTGAGIMREEYLEIPRRAYIDTDPGYVQMRTAATRHESDLTHLANHTVHFSFGCNIGQADCVIPELGLVWHPTVQPVCLDLWPPAAPPEVDAPFTTVIKWQPYDTVEYADSTYGMKDVEFMRFLDLAAQSQVPLELAMEGSPPRPGDELIGRGWRTRDSLEVSRSLDDYRAYIHSSRGEWSVAKNCYVEARSGWFSDRSATYLASGRPVLLQATGYERWLQTGEGVVAFSTLEDALAGLDAFQSDWTRHHRAARELASAYFDARTVMSDLVEVAMAAPAGDGPTLH